MSRKSYRVAATAAAAVAVTAAFGAAGGSVAAAASSSTATGVVFAENDAVGGNTVFAFDRAADGTLTTMQGALGFSDGSLGSAGMCPMGQIAKQGSVYLVGDGGNGTVRVVDRAAGKVRSFAAPGSMVHPLGVAVDATRRIVYVADTGNCVVRAATY